MFRSIKSKIAMFVGLILIFVIGLQICANLLFAESYYINQKGKKILSVYKELQEVEIESSDDLAFLLEGYEEDNNIQFIVADSKYVCVYNSSQNPVSKRTTEANPWTNYDFEKNKDVFQEDAKPTSRRSDGKKDDYIRLYGHLNNGDDSYYILMRTRITAIQTNVKITNDFMLIIAVIALLVGAITTYLFVSKITSPIEEIDKVALNVAEFDFSKRATENLSNDEIGRLAHNINMMADNLEKAIEDMQDINRGLEQDNLYMAKIDRMRKEFIANASHELKTPITILSSYAQMLQDDIEGLDKDYYYDVIMEECEKMNVLILTMLNLSNMEQGLTNLAINKINLSQLTKDVVNQQKGLMLKKEIEYQEEIQNNCFVMGNELYLQQAVINYLSNAIVHTKPGGVIKVMVEKDGEYGRVRVYNEGKNIDVSNLNRIWDSFYRGEEERADVKQKSVGLGLYIVRTIMNAHQGKYGVTNVKGGVIFWLKVPRHSD